MSAKKNLPFATSHAFLIGINNYQEIPSLESPISDAKKLGQKLREDHDYEVHLLLNPSLESIRSWIHAFIPEKIIKRTSGKPQDRFLFFFAGHGIAVDGEQGPNGYLVPSDAKRNDKESLLPMYELQEAFAQLPCEHGLIILDCCFAGVFKWTTGQRSFFWEELPNVIYEERFLRYCLDPAWQVLSSTAYDQKALDTLYYHSLGFRKDDSENVHSPFALALFEALDGAADWIPNGQGNGLITASELYLYLRNRVEGLSLTRNSLSETAISLGVSPKKDSVYKERQTPMLFPLPRHDKGEYVFFVPNHPLNLTPTPNKNPFKGLSSFDEEDSILFFGREQEVEALYTEILERQFTVVVGASGTGKSSLIKAGIIPRMKRTGFGPISVIRPGVFPMDNLAQLLSEYIKEEEDNKPVIIIDQYEELITQTASSDQVREFQETLLALIEGNSEQKIILSIRSDFEPQFEDSALSHIWKNSRFHITPLTREEFKQCIVKPAIQEVFYYEPESLVQNILDEVSYAPGALPLLSFTLSELYHAYLESGRNDRVFSETEYLKLGGVIGSLRAKADQVYKQLAPLEKLSMKKIMLRMVSMEGDEIASKRIFTDKFTYEEKEDEERANKIIDLLADARLIVRGIDSHNQPYAEPAHDALIKAWGTLWGWIKEVGIDKIIRLNKLNQASEDYIASNKHAKFLWNSTRLGDWVEEVSKKDSLLMSQERAFIQKCLVQEIKLKKRNRTIVASVIVILSLISGIAIFQADRATTEGKNAENKARIADSTSIVADSNAAAAVREAQRANQNAELANQNLIKSNENLMEALDFQIEILESEIEKEETSLRLARNLGMNMRIKKHTNNIFQIRKEIKLLKDEIRTIKEQNDALNIVVQ